MSSGEVEDYLALCKKTTGFLVSEFEKAYSQVNKLTVNEFLRGQGVPQLPSLCIK